MKFHINPNKEIFVEDATHEDLIAVLNSGAASMGSQTPTVTEKQPRKTPVRGGALRPWTSEELMKVVSVVENIGADEKQPAETAMKRLRGSISRTDAGIYHTAYRVWQYLHGINKGDGLSKNLRRLLDQNGVQPISGRNQTGLLGDMHRIPVRQA